MSHDIAPLLSRLIHGPATLRQIRFAAVNATAPALACQVDFPRLEIVLEGALTDAAIAGETALMMQHDVLYVPAGGWNCPRWPESWGHKHRTRRCRHR